MGVARVYRMIAREGCEEDLRRVLLGFAENARGTPHCNGYEVLQDMADPRIFTLIEKWETVEAHKAARAAVPDEDLTGLKAALAGPAEGAYYYYRN